MYPDNSTKEDEMTWREHDHTVGGRTAGGWSRTLWLTLGMIALGMGTAMAQAFNSGSTGADGALDFSGTPPGTVIDFDPKAFTPALDADGDSVYHFTTITIPANVTIRLRTTKAGAAPIHWLATGAVVIDGILDLNGEDGHTPVTPRIPSVPGPGGFAGGIGTGTPNLPPQAGFGPGGGCAGGGNAGHATSISQGNLCTTGGLSYGNTFLLPLIGGSGGGGLGSGYGGGAGGGAIMIASSVSISVNGAIRANGGTNGFSPFVGLGSGGAIRLVAPTVTGAGNLEASDGGSIAAPGRIRIEALQNTFIGSTTGVARATTLLPAPILLPTGPLPQLRVVSVGGQTVPAHPRGTFNPADVTLNTAQAVAIQLEGRNIPPGTPITVTVANETEGTQVVASPPLAGTAALSTATVTVTVPAGFSQIFSHATW
jgi:hypothetical protein